MVQLVSAETINYISEIAETPITHEVFPFVIINYKVNFSFNKNLPGYGFVFTKTILNIRFHKWDAKRTKLSFYYFLKHYLHDRKRIKT